MLAPALRCTGCLAAVPAPPRVNAGLFNPTALSFSVLLLSEACQPCLPFHLSLSLPSFCSLGLTVPKPDPDSPAAAAAAPTRGSPGSVPLPGSLAPSLASGCSVPGYPAASPSAWPLWARIHEVRPRLGAVLQVSQILCVPRLPSKASG